MPEADRSTRRPPSLVTILRRGSDAPLRRARRRERRRDRARARQAARGARSQRRRQDDADQPAVGRPRRVAGTSATRATTSRGIRPDRRSRLGIGRSYQKTNIFPAFTVFENCRLAAQSRAPRALHLFADARAFRRSRDAARARARRGGSRARVRSRRATLVARRAAPARDRDGARDAPEVLLLDEPLAGMGAEEAARMVELLKRARAASTRSCWSSTTWTRCSRSPTSSP